MLTEIQKEIIQRLDGDGVIAIALLGSHGSGDPALYSDLDIDVIMASPPEEHTHRYELWGDTLASIQISGIAKIRKRLSDPKGAIWAGHSFPNCAVALDRTGELSALKAEAASIARQTLEEKGRHAAIAGVREMAEEVCKIAGGLREGEAWRAAASQGYLHYRLNEAAAMLTGTLLSSENQQFVEVGKAIPGWEDLASRSLGITAANHGDQCRASLEMYVALADLLETDHEIIRFASGIARKGLA